MITDYQQMREDLIAKREAITAVIDSLALLIGEESISAPATKQAKTGAKPADASRLPRRATRRS
jgi:hypothetical protein